MTPEDKEDVGSDYSKDEDMVDVKRHDRPTRRYRNTFVAHTNLFALIDNQGVP